MGLVKINNWQWVRAEAVAVMETETEFLPKKKPTGELPVGSDPADFEGPTRQRRTTTFKSEVGVVLLTFKGVSGYSNDDGDSNIELRIMNAVHDEVINAVVEGRPAKHSRTVADEVHQQRKGSN